MSSGGIDDMDFDDKTQYEDTTNDLVIQLRDAYYDAIVKLQYKEDILRELPDPDYYNYFPIMNALVLKLVHECKAYEKFGDDLEAMEVISSLKDKIDICKEQIKTVRDDLKDQSFEEQSKHPVRHLIFAKTNVMGGTFLERDLKKIPSEYYDKVSSAMEFLEYGDFHSSGNKIRQLTNNKKMFGLFEIKEFKVRLVYRVLSGDMVYVMLARMKKDDNSAVDQKDLIVRGKNTMDEYQKLKEQVKDASQRDLLLMEHDNIKQNIKKILNVSSTKNRGEVK